MWILRQQFLLFLWQYQWPLFHKDLWHLPLKGLRKAEEIYLKRVRRRILPDKVYVWVTSLARSIHTKLQRSGRDLLLPIAFRRLWPCGKCQRSLWNIWTRILNDCIMTPVFCFWRLSKRHSHAKTMNKELPRFIWGEAVDFMSESTLDQVRSVLDQVRS